MLSTVLLFYYPLIMFRTKEVRNIPKQSEERGTWSSENMLQVLSVRKK